MKKKYLLPILVCLSLLACSSPYKGISRLGEEAKSRTAFLSPFTTDVKSYLFNAEMSFGKRAFSGLMIVKPIAEQHFRVAFTAKAGPKIIDFEWTNGDFQLNDCIEQLNRKVILKWLESNMTLLLESIRGVKQTKVYINELNEDSVYCFKWDKKPLFYHYESTNHQLQKIVKANSISEKNIIRFEEYQDSFPRLISLEHPSLSLSLRLKLLKIKPLENDQ